MSPALIPIESTLPLFYLYDQLLGVIRKPVSINSSSPSPSSHEARNVFFLFIRSENLLKFPQSTLFVLEVKTKPFWKKKEKGRNIPRISLLAKFPKSLQAGSDRVRWDINLNDCKKDSRDSGPIAETITNFQILRYENGGKGTGGGLEGSERTFS